MMKIIEQTENGNFIKIPIKIAQIVFGTLLGLIFTGVIAINLRFGRIETNDAVQSSELQTIGEWIKQHQQQEVWTRQDHQRFNDDLVKIMADKEWVHENFIEKKK